LRGKRVSIGAPGSGTEVKALQVMEAYGLMPTDLQSQERLGAGESAGALKDRKIDAFFWDGGLPTAAILDLAATPGSKVNLIPHGDAVPKMVAKYGPLYFVATIPKGVYKGVDEDVPVAAVTNLLVVNEKMDDKQAYELTKLILEHTADLVAVHKAASEMNLKSAVVGSAIPFHPGALRYFKGKGSDNTPSKQMNWRQAIIARPSVKQLRMLAFSLLALLATALPASAGQDCVLVRNGEQMFKHISGPDTELRLSFNHLMYGSAVEEIFQVQGDGFHLIQLRYSERRLVDFYGYESAQFVGGAWIVTPQQRIFSRPGPARESGSLNDDRLNLAA
jgi:NMT1-like family